MALRFSTGLRDLFAAVLKDTFEDCVIDVYDGAQPATPDSPPTGTKIGSITESGGSFSHGSATNGLEWDVDTGSGTASIKSGETWIFTCSTSGTARYARVKTNATDADGSSTTQARMDLSIGIGSGNIRMPRVDYTSGETANVTSLDIPIATQGAN